MGRIAKYPGVEIGEDKRPAPGERVEDYRVSGAHRVVWGKGPAPSTIVVERIGDDTPKDSWYFDTDAELGDDLPRQVRAAPTKHGFTPLEDRNGTPIHRFKGKRPENRSRSITLDDVPGPVLDVLASKDRIEVVETLGAQADA